MTTNQIEKIRHFKSHTISEMVDMIELWQDNNPSSIIVKQNIKLIQKSPKIYFGQIFYTEEREQ